MITNMWQGWSRTAACRIVSTLLFLHGIATAATNGIPLGLPPLPPQETVEKTALAAIGQRLFFDKRLSADGTVSCGSCHIREKQFSDGRPRGIGIAGQVGTRNTPSLLNVVYATSLFWDGRADTLEAQAVLPLTNLREHGLSAESAVLEIVAKDPEYRRGFAQALGPRDLSVNDVLAAIGGFERTLLSGDSPADRFMYAGDQLALSNSAMRGLTLFRGRARCATCHTIGDTSALYTDLSFHVSPLGLPPTANAGLVELTQRMVELRTRNDVMALNSLVVGDSDFAALGRFVVTGNPRDIGLFKTPSLRNVALTAPYFHDGSVATLAEAVDVELYSRGDAIRYPIVLTMQEKEDLVEFLKALSSP
jgi:cytochrome c peroxidase